MCFSWCKKGASSGERKTDNLFDYNAFYDPSMPTIFKNASLSELREGICLTVKGTTKPGDDFHNFFIYLICDNDNQDIALFVNPLAATKVIICDSRLDKVWKKEASYRLSPFPLKDNSEFKIQILVTEDCYMVAANGFHFAEYKHRLPYKLVRAAVIKGDIFQVQLDSARVDHYPQVTPQSKARLIPLVGDFKRGDRKKDGKKKKKDDDDGEDSDDCGCVTEYKAKGKNDAAPPGSEAGDDSDEGIQEIIYSYPEEEGEANIPLPFYGQLTAKQFTVGRCLRIDGHMAQAATSLSVSLQHSQDVWPQPDVAFRFKLSFGGSEKEDENVATGNDCQDGTWGEEVTEELDPGTSSFRGKIFSLHIVYGSDAFEVHSNSSLGGRAILQFPHRLNLDIIDTVLVQGDFRMMNIVLESEFEGISAPPASPFRSPAKASPARSSPAKSSPAKSSPAKSPPRTPTPASKSKKK